MESRSGEALGLVETFGLVAGIEACDAMLKAASVRLVAMEQTIPAMITIQIVGETAAVQAACDAGAAAGARVGKVLSVHVIPRPSDEVRRLLIGDGGSSLPAPGGTSREGEAGGVPLEEMTVRELRDIARQQEDFPLKGREISRATREQLLDLLRS